MSDMSLTEENRQYEKTVSVELTVSQWNSILADLNIYRIENSDEFSASTRQAKLLAGEISRQIDPQTPIDFGEFAGQPVEEIEEPRE